MGLELHPQLAKDTILLGKFDLCLLLLMDDESYPWFILVPDRKNITEIFQLSREDQITLMEESSFLSSKLAELFNADKLNIAALGNVVPQLHIHHIVRYKNDPAWPGPVWGVQPPARYSYSTLGEIKKKVSKMLAGKLSATP